MYVCEMKQYRILFSYIRNIVLNSIGKNVVVVKLSLVLNRESNEISFFTYTSIVINTGRLHSN